MISEIWYIYIYTLDDIYTAISVNSDQLIFLQYNDVFKSWCTLLQTDRRKAISHTLHFTPQWDFSHPVIGLSVRCWKTAQKGQVANHFFLSNNFGLAAEPLDLRLWYIRQTDSLYVGRTFVESEKEEPAYLKVMEELYGLLGVFSLHRTLLFLFSAQPRGQDPSVL